MTPLFLGDLLADLGFGQQVVVALSAGLIVWYAFRMLRIGRKAGSVVESLIKYGMAVTTFVAVGIYFGWVDPTTLFNDLLAGGSAFLDMLIDGARLVWDWLSGVVL